MKKIGIILLIAVGAVLGYWLARENQKLFELPMPPIQLQDGKTGYEHQPGNIEVGMDMWQVKERWGTPTNRHILSERIGDKKEIWIYGDCQCYFENGYLMEMRGGQCEWRAPEKED